MGERVGQALGAAPFLLAALCTALLLGLAPRFGTAEAPSGQALAACAAFGPYACLLWLRVPRGGLVAAAVLLCALGAGLALCRSPALLSDDVYRHLWDGKLLVHQVDPYAYAPDAPRLSDLRDAHHARINHPSVPTIYPPLAQLLFATGYHVHPSPLGQRLLALALHLAAALWVFGLLRQGSAGVAGAPRATRAAALLALNPLALLESALNGHYDIAVGALVVSFVWALPRPGFAAAILTAVTALKLVGAALLPLLWRRSRWACFVAAVLAALCVVPLLRAGFGSGAAASGLRHYASRWQGNAALFVLLEQGSARLVDALAALERPAPELADDEIRLGWSAPLVAALADTPFDLRPVPLLQPKAEPAPGVWSRGHLSGLLARGLSLALFGALLLWMLRREPSAADFSRWTLFAVLLLAPQLQPWYLLWLLPLEVAVGRHAGLLWSALALSAYASIDHWIGSRHWIELPLAAPLQAAVVLGALWLEARAVRAKPEPDPEPVLASPGR